MTAEEYARALEREVVTYHRADGRCAADRTLGLDQCDCGALEQHRFTKQLESDVTGTR